ncbi:phasin family protein [Hoeflea olei]|uniref:Phasin family protein n=1 Tax=Hoeflea olei TaxID=1480615 RepID=A0A1C1YWK0_9HYPH|nr:TIGR01841 family phasin [Hoeflea olei]OCW57766.1 phasin family protein [Hoeflea olei]
MAEKKSTDDLVSMFLNFGRDLKLPQPDLDAIVARHQKNLEALDEAARTAGSGASSILTRQREMVREALDEISAMAGKMKAGSDPKAMMSAQAEFAKHSFEMAIRNTSEIAGMAQKSGSETFKVLQASMQDTLEDIRKAMTRQGRS